jgi:hypothetical protein
VIFVVVILGAVCARAPGHALPRAVFG